DRLAKLARYAATNLDGECAQVLARCGKKNGLLPVTADELGSWHVVANWLLTRQGHFRKQVDAEQGFPPRGDVFDLEGPERGKNKQAMQNLLKEELAAVPGLCAALEAVRCLPSPRYAEAAWDVLWALLVRGRRSDAVDLPISRGGGEALHRSAAGASHRRGRCRAFDPES